MREIKFRAWDKGSSQMLPVANMKFVSAIDYIGTVDEIDAVKYGDYYEITTLYKDECIPMQYTGLKDKNGVEIYEGDIVRQYGSTPSRLNEDLGAGIIEWLDDSTRFAWVQNGLHDYWMSNSAYYEVIGNIYENPELNKESL